MPCTMEMDALGAGLSPDNALIFYESAPPLERIATLKVAAELVSQKLINECRDFTNDLQGLNQVRQWVSDSKDRSYRWNPSLTLIPVPDEILVKIFEQMQSVARHLPDWLWHHMDLIDRVITRLPAEFLRDFVWKWDGNVDYVLTAEKLIYGGKLTDRERFKMLCAYCVECELEEMYDSFDWASCADDEEFQGNNHVFYWYCWAQYYKPVVSEGDDRSYEIFMLDTSNAFNLMAIDYYFLNVLMRNTEEAMDFCRGQMMQLHSFHVKFLISRMTEAEQKQMFESYDIALRIMERFVKDSCPHFALQLWNHVKDSVSGEQYVQMMRTTILNIGVEFPDQDRYPNWFAQLAMDIWTNTPRHLKQFTFQYEDGRLMFDWYRWFGHNYTYNSDENFLRNDSLLLEILCDADAQFRREFWIREWTRLMVGSRPGFLRRFMFTCVNDLQEIREFERKIVSSEEMLTYFAKMFLLLDPDVIVSLNHFFDILAPDSNQKRELKMKMIELINQLERLPAFFMWSDVVDNHEFLDSLVEFFRDLDQENKMNVVCIWIEKLAIGKRFYGRSFGLTVFDNVMLIAERLCDQVILQIIAKKMPSREEFIRIFPNDSDEEPDND